MRHDEMIVFIQSYTCEHGYAPSYREIATRLNVSLNTAHRLVHEAIKAGVVTKVDGIARSTAVMKTETEDMA